MLSQIKSKRPLIKFLKQQRGLHHFTSHSKRIAELYDESYLNRWSQWAADQCSWGDNIQERVGRRQLRHLLQQLWIRGISYSIKMQAQIPRWLCGPVAEAKPSMSSLQNQSKMNLIATHYYNYKYLMSSIWETEIQKNDIHQYTP